MKPPNLLFIYTDEQRFDTLAAYGNEQIEMPNLNRLAESSCVFDRAYITQPVCTPSRSSLLTGLYPHTNGCTANNIPLDLDIPCLPEMLPEGRYTTAHFGKWHLGDELFPQHGFQHWLGIEQYNKHFRPGRDKEKVSDYSKWLIEQGYRPENGKFFSRGEAAGLPEELSKPKFLADNASRFIREHQKEPFCLYVNFLEPHMPFNGPRDNQYDPENIPLPPNFDSPPTENNHLRYRLFHDTYANGKKFGCHSDNPDEMRRLIARYWGLCSLVDTHCGTILDTLDECGLWDDTIIVFTSDHGDMMGSHQLIAKCTMYEESVRVPMLVKLPGQKEMRRINRPVSHVDLVPTLLELMGAPPPDHLEGRSQKEAMLSGGDSRSDQVVIEWQGPNNGLGPDDPQKVEVPEEWEGRIEHERSVAAVTDPIRTVYSQDGRWKLNVSPKLGQHELYDLEADPYEKENIFGRSDAAGVTEELFHRLREWQRRTGDKVNLADFT